jgi:NAD(P)-dependent dehydrogenase (short-subunit alcohol dehydrogenase family)
MTELLANTVAVVTGAASGNGRAIALAFARHGAKAVVVADVQAAPREGDSRPMSAFWRKRRLKRPLCHAT